MLPEQVPGINPSIVIIGAGISGLSIAYRIKKSIPQAKLRVLEAGKRAGGVVNTIHDQDTLMETGPESFSTLKPDLMKLAEELEIADRIISTNPEHRRSFINLSKKLHPLPEGLMFFAPTKLCALAGSDIFSLAGKLRMSLDLLLPARKESGDESLSSFVKRRLGGEVLEKLAEPMIAAIYGGNPELLSAQSTVAQLVEMERKHGSIIKGLIKSLDSQSLKSAGPRYATMASFDTGIGLLIDRLLQTLDKDCLELEKEVIDLSRSPDQKSWVISCSDQSSYGADYIVLSTDAEQCAKLLNKHNSKLAAYLSGIPRSPALIINLLYERNKLKHELDGLGFVVPKKENTLVSACSFSSVKFGGRSPSDKVLLRVFTGGLQKANVLDMDEKSLVESCHLELKELLKIEAGPLLSIVKKHRNAIPQYMVGHKQRLDLIDIERANLPGLELIGNSYGGVGLSDCVRSANAAAARLAKSICKTV